MANNKTTMMTNNRTLKCDTRGRNDLFHMLNGGGVNRQVTTMIYSRRNLDLDGIEWTKTYSMAHRMDKDSFGDE